VRRFSNDLLYRYLREYRVGGIEALKEVPFHQQQSQLAAYRTSIEADARQRPPASVAEAAARIADLTGLRRGPTQVRQFLKALGMKPRKVGQIPAKADVTAQEAFKTAQLEPRLVEAKSGQRIVFFLDAAHVVFAPFLGVVWSSYSREHMRCSSRWVAAIVVRCGVAATRHPETL
jgi:transposase